MAIPGPPSFRRRAFLRALRWRIVLRKRSPIESIEPTEPIEPSKQVETSKLLRALLASGVFGVVIAGICEYLNLMGLIHVGAARFFLVFVWVVGTIGTFVSVTRSRTHKIVATTFIGLFLGAGLIVLDAWVMGYKAWLEDQQLAKAQNAISPEPPKPKLEEKAEEPKLKERLAKKMSKPEEKLQKGQIYERELLRFLDNRTVVFVEPQWMDNQWKVFIRHLGNKQPANNVNIDYWNIRDGIGSARALIVGLNINPDPGGVQFLPTLTLRVRGDDERLMFKISDSKETIFQELWLQIKADGRKQIASRAKDGGTHEIIFLCKDPEVVGLDISWDQFPRDSGALECDSIGMGHLLPERTNKIFGLGKTK